MGAENQHIRARVIIEMLGMPRQHVDETIKSYVEKIANDQGFIILNKKFAESREQGGMWSTFVEIELVLKGVPKLIGFCFDYMPSSIEILKPSELAISSNDIMDFLNDLQARLHSLDMAIKQLRAENEFLRRNMKNSVRNVIFLSLRGKSLKKEEISENTGINQSELEIYLKKLIEEGIIKEENNLYSLKKK